MTNGVSSVLKVIQRDLLGLKHQVDLTAGSFDRMKLAAVGAGGVVFGAGILFAMAKLVKHGEEFVHQQALMKSAGMSQIEIAEATGKAWQNTNDVLGTGVSENLKNIRELRMVFGDTQEALNNLQVVSKAQVVMNSVRGQGAGDQVFDMAKALEIKGASQDPAHFYKLLDEMVKASIASGGRVLGSDFLGTFKYGRTATQGWDDRFIGLILPTLIQEMKSSGGSGGAGGPGNALQSAFQAVVGGTMSNKAAEEFYKLGLTDKSHIIFTSTGSIKGIRPGGIKGSEEFQADPYQWVQDVLMPALKAKGITTPEAVREEVSHMFVNRTAQQIMTMFATQQMRFEKDATLIGDAKGLGAYDQLIKDDPVARMKAFSEAWSNLMTALGAPLVKPAYDMLMKLTLILNDLAKVAADHPDATRVIGEVVAGVGAVAVAFGAFAVGTAAASAIGLLTGAGGLLALAAGIEALGHALPSIPKWMIDAAAGAAAGAAIGSAFPGIGTGVGAAAGAAAGAIGSQLRDSSHMPNNPSWNLNNHLPGGKEGVDGLYHKQSYVPSSNDRPKIQTIVYTMLDGRVLAKTVSEEQGRAMALPSPGATRFDGRQTAAFPSDTLSL